MPSIRFIRTTHENGRHCSFSAEALKFWQAQGEMVGEVLRPECPLTFAEIVTGCQELALESLEPGLLWPLNEAHIAWILIHLLEYDMAGIVVESP
jgi:hypothetical protein